MGIVEATARAVPRSATTSATGNAVAGLDIPEQFNTVWCWCAVTLGLRNFYDGPFPPLQQCDVANAVLGIDTACADPLGPQAFKLLALERALRRFDLMLGDPIEEPLTMAQITRQIDAGRPIATRIEFSLGAGHFVVICGYRSEGIAPTVLVEDPATGLQRDMSLSKFTRSFDGPSRWTHSYLTRPRQPREAST